MPGSPAAHEHAAGEHLVRKTLHVFPKTDFMPVHADEQSALVRGGQNGIAVPGFFRIEDGDAGGIDSWMSHIRSPCVVRRNFCPAGLMFFSETAPPDSGSILRSVRSASGRWVPPSGGRFRSGRRYAPVPGVPAPGVSSAIFCASRRNAFASRTPSLPSLLIHQLASSVLFAALNA